ncbi:hypothetical protein [Mycolicibacterium sphagni]|uniref:hypothetical protein n=1 Tax=Mycolicibacterium sphagni TaxID=1786 RepID=UPI0021F280B9|nr:hypothetical protein [Mycolicibacterium sphagni]MCV7178369.1 hypothetical protein [Mycolicibacterium sphagni]
MGRDFAGNLVPLAAEQLRQVDELVRHGCVPIGASGMVGSVSWKVLSAPRNNPPSWTTLVTVSVSQSGQESAS